MRKVKRNQCLNIYHLRINVEVHQLCCRLFCNPYTGTIGYQGNIFSGPDDLRDPQGYPELTQIRWYWLLQAVAIQRFNDQRGIIPLKQGII